MSKNPVTDPITDQEIAFRSREQIQSQILDRLWQLANLNPEQTRGSIAGQIKAMAMIVAIEGLIPNRRLSRVEEELPAPPPKAQIYIGKPYRRQQHQAEDTSPGDAAIADERQPAAPQAPEPEPPPSGVPSPTLDPHSTKPVNPFFHHGEMNWVPDSIGGGVGPLRLPFSPRKGGFGKGRSNL